MKQKKARYFDIISLGCPKNDVESGIIIGTFLQHGYQPLPDGGIPDVIVVNSCAFLAAARAELLERLEELRAEKRRNPDMTLVVCGCLDRHPDKPKFQAEFPEVDLWAGINDTARIPELLAGAAPAAPGPCTYLADESLPRVNVLTPHLAYLKIADGCNNCCAYCSIPALRGKLRSRPIASAVKEAARLAAEGVKEIMVIAQDVTAYGLDRPESGETLAKLLAALQEVPGDFRIRLLYTHPAHYTPELIDVLAAGGKIIPYLDIPLQHISDRILRQMNRHIDGSGIRKLLAELRRRIPGLQLRTTMIAGLPGETEAEFNELKEFLKEQRFQRLGVFTYDPEPGTPGAKLPDQVPAEVAEKRAAELMRAQRARMRRAQKELIGTDLPVCIDIINRSEDIAYGHTDADAPGIDLQTYVVTGGRLKPGSVVTCRILLVTDNYELVAEPLKTAGGKKR